MRDKEEFYQILRGVAEGQAEDAKRLVGDFDFSRYVLRFSQAAQDVEGPLLAVVRVPQSMAGFPEPLFDNPLRRTALEDYLTRRAAQCMDGLRHFDGRGIARRRLSTVRPGQKILPRTAVAVGSDYVEARVYVNLPVVNDRLDAEAAAEIFFEDLPRVVTHSFIYHNLPSNEVDLYVHSMEDMDAVRQLLPTRGWVAFAGHGSRISRQRPGDEPAMSGVSPLSVEEAMWVALEPRPGVRWHGAGIPAGITVILGDESSGRRELMHALAAGIYNHVPGDGREQVISLPDVVYVAAEPGRSVQGVNLSPFYPGGAPAAASMGNFSSAHAEAYLSQAASVVEALEAGARVLLFDESDSVPAFLGADARLAGACGPQPGRFAPLSVMARQIVNELGISIVVAGCASVGAFLPMADTVLVMSDFCLKDITQEARDFPVRPLDWKAPPTNVHELAEQARSIVPSSIEPGWGRSEANISAEEVDLLVFGDDIVDLGGVRQLAEVEQTATIGAIFRYVKTRYLMEPRPVREVLDLVDRDLSTEGLDCLDRDVNGMLARPRRYELAAALNRLPSLRVFRETA